MAKPSEMHFNKVAFYVHFFDLPMASMNQSMVRRLGNAVGEFENVDCNSKGFVGALVCVFTFRLILPNRCTVE